jgi:hypothetical protein
MSDARQRNVAIEVWEKRRNKRVRDESFVRSSVECRTFTHIASSVINVALAASPTMNDPG